MKFRLAVLFVLLTIGLVACSFASDITPPPGVQSLDTLPTNAVASQTAAPTTIPTLAPTTGPTQDLTPVATSDGSTPVATGSTTPAAEASPTAQNAGVAINGVVTPPTGVTLPSGTKATLLIYNTSSQQVEQSLDTVILPDGTFQFNNVPATTNNVFLVTVDYGGVTYNSSPTSFDATKPILNIPLTIFKTSNDLNLLSITQTHLQFDFSTSGQVQVMALYIVANPGETTVIVPSDGSTVPFIQIPAGATSVSYQLAQSSAPLLMATNGFAMLPGSNLQYGIIASYSLAYTGRLVYTQPFSLPVTAATVIVPEGVKIRSEQLTDAGTQALSGTTYHLFQGNSLASGSTLSMTISGMPGDKAGFQLDQRTLTIIGVGAIGLILLALGIFLFVRDRKLRKLEDESDEEDEMEGEQEEVPDNDREGILDAIIALEDKFKAGDISKEAFEKRRDEFKQQLAKLA